MKDEKREAESEKWMIEEERDQFASLWKEADEDACRYKKRQKFVKGANVIKVELAKSQQCLTILGVFSTNPNTEFDLYKKLKHVTKTSQKVLSYISLKR
ncbi:5925_t:CDS:2 [Racocetra fulgida]|uniref:5925_t:CDS:1 n=1 Tax=Racocetra fulgida TaxID=60492 RepID=A0A9N9FST8_9GLOM|nr:5925_t:CDS:2 [Racocetra fulgida]